MRNQLEFEAHRLLGWLSVIVAIIVVTLIMPLSAYSQTPSKVVRPRMLIGERDPLTGFGVLRARYATGARAPEAIDAWELNYLLTRDESFARRAVEEMRRKHPPQSVGSRTYPEDVKWSLAFDGLYNYQGFDATL